MDSQNNILAEGHSSSISFFKPNRFNAPSISDLEKKIFNDKRSGHQVSLKDIILKNGGRDRIVSVEHYDGSTTWKFKNGSKITRYDSSPKTIPPFEGMDGNVSTNI